MEFGGDVGTKSYNLSLQGVTSALAFMDIVQGRLDRADAAVIIGGEAYTAASTYDFRQAHAPEIVEDRAKDTPSDGQENIEEPRSNPNASETDEERGLGETRLNTTLSGIPDRVLMQGYRVYGCDFPTVVEAFGWQSVNLEPGVFLYMILCEMADVNVPHYVALEDAGRVTVLEFQEAASETGDRVSQITNPRWNENTQELTSYQYYSPNQDCGKHETHSLDLQSLTPYLSAARIKEACDGVQTNPENYPLSWAGEGD